MRFTLFFTTSYEVVMISMSLINFYNKGDFTMSKCIDTTLELMLQTFFSRCTTINA